MHEVVVLLGSNIDRERHLPAAVGLLAAAVEVVAVSTVYESAAIDRPEQPYFFNAAVRLRTPLSPVELKDGLLAAIESRLGRVRSADKYAPRPIDLDIILYDDAVLDYTPADGRTRHIPEPDLLRYAHCALPVAELRPHGKHPETGEPLPHLAARLMAQLDAAARPRLRRDIDPWSGSGDPSAKA